MTIKEDAYRPKEAKIESPNICLSGHYGVTHMSLSRRWLSGFVLAVMVLGLTAARAQSPTGAPEANSPEPPARVGRISLLQGTVSWHTADQNQWSPAVLNYPITSGDAFWTEPNARAELRIGDDSLRLDSATELDVQQLDDHTLVVAVPQGTINVHVQSLPEGDSYRVTTPRGTVDLFTAGTYRIDAGSTDTPTSVAVLRGHARFSGDRALTITAGETALASGNDPHAYAYRVVETVPTSFDNWSLARDNYEEPRQAAQYVSPEMTGYEDLGAYGQWETTPDYGAVWYPTDVAVDWAPYRFGHWAWIFPWGWTWIDDTPWGFAPFHYGRWVTIGNRWCWWPGERNVSPVFAPALVAFINRDHDIGWFPLAPGEEYRPAYRHSDRYLHEINAGIIGHNAAAEAHENFRNRSFATVVPQNAFASRSIAHDALHVDPQQLAKAPVVGTAPPHAETQQGKPAPGPAIVHEQHMAGPTGKQLSSSRITSPAPSTVHATSAAAPGPVIHPLTPGALPPLTQRYGMGTGETLPSHRAPEPRETAAPQPTPQAAPAPHSVEPQRREVVAAPPPREIAVPRPSPAPVFVPSHEGWMQQPTAPAARAPAPIQRAAPAQARPEERFDRQPEPPTGR
jgi:hypothetical protein